MNKLGKRQGHQGTQWWKCGALRLHDQRGRVFFASLPSRRLCRQCVGNPEIKRGIFVWVREKTKKKLWQWGLSYSPSYNLTAFISWDIRWGKKAGCVIVTWTISCYESKSTNILYEDSEVSESLWLAGMKCLE